MEILMGLGIWFLAIAIVVLILVILNKRAKL